MPQPAAETNLRINSANVFFDMQVRTGMLLIGKQVFVSGCIMKQNMDIAAIVVMIISVIVVVIQRCEKRNADQQDKTSN